MLGATGVGKTSLVRRFVESTFSDSYLATVGVKVDRKRVETSGRVVSLMLWDLQGAGGERDVRLAYLRGAAAYLLAIDGTRVSTLDTAERLHQRVSITSRKLPFIALINKADCHAEWEVSDAHIARLRNTGWQVLLTSAKTGEGVEDAFQAIAERTIPK